MPTTIIGVDYSGAQRESKTWIAQGQLTDDGELYLNVNPHDKPRCISRAKLYELLLDTTAPAVAAMDFPFGVPVSFATKLCDGREPAAMPEVWQAVANMTWDEFINNRDQFVANHRSLQCAGASPLLPGTLYCCNGDPHRAGDAKHLSAPVSPLHIAGHLNMPPMTYHGIRMLQHLHDKNPHGRRYVPPMKPTAQPEQTVTLLETMPGAFLQVCGLPSRGYKSDDNKDKARALRRNILDGLPTRTGWPALDLTAVRNNCLANDDCLDAVVAFVCAASWARCQAHFHHPTPDELADARLEGWIYIPKSVCAHLAA